MVADPTQLRAYDLREWRAQFTDTQPIAELRARAPAVCVGVVHSIRLVPGKTLEVTIEDGSGRLTAVWMGRSSLPGLELGAGLRLEGTVAEERDGRKLLRNPEWTLVPEPYA